VERYEKQLIAPKGKSVHWFEHSGHAPHLEEPEEFVKTLRGIKESKL
jgi:pimeloyl-ACP methyl ester carboxylesterase